MITDKEKQEIRNQAFREAAAICRDGVYNGDYYSSFTDVQDDVCRWAEKRILEQIVEINS